MVKNKRQQPISGDLVYGVHPVKELLKTKRRKVLEIYILKPEPKIWRQMQEILPKYKVTVHEMGREQMERTTGTTDHQGIAALAEPFPLRRKFFDKENAPFLLLLDGIQDVRNLGAIIRSAYCTGVDGIIVCRKNGAPLTGAAIKASAGLVERMQVYEATSVGAALNKLKDAGYNIYATALGGKTNATKMDYKKPLCVIIGSEGKGVSPESKKAGTIITLPQKTDDISYNASVAAGIVLFMIRYNS
jgi:23S rRNA (guanosine2251-2'-O)-methyltransferase